MKRLAVELAAVSAASAADPVRAPDGRILPEEPQSLPVAGGVWSFPPAEVQLAAGYAKATAKEIADDASAKAAASAAEEAAKAAQAVAEAQAELPMQSATGFAALDDDGHWVELLPTGDGLPIIGVQVSNSPLTAEQRAQMKAKRKATHDALKAEAKAAKTQKEINAVFMKAMFGKDAE